MGMSGAEHADHGGAAEFGRTPRSLRGPRPARGKRGTGLFGVAIKPVEVVGRPSFDFKRPELTDRPGREPSPPPDDGSIKAALPRLIVALRADSEEQAREYIDAFRAKGISAGADPAITGTRALGAWRRPSAGLRHARGRRRAHQRLGAGERRLGRGALGRGANQSRHIRPGFELRSASRPLALATAVALGPRMVRLERHELHPTGRSAAGRPRHHGRAQRDLPRSGHLGVGPAVPAGADTRMWCYSPVMLPRRCCGWTPTSRYG